MQFFIRVMHVSRNEVVLGGAFAGSQLHYEMIIVSYLFFCTKGVRIHVLRTNACMVMCCHTCPEINGDTMHIHNL